MRWPLPQDFNEAVQNPTAVFVDPDLRDGEPRLGPFGMPMPRSGNFADVYQFRGPDGREWAVKCFTRAVFGLPYRYAKVAEALARANLPFGVGFTFLAEGVKVKGEWRPVVKMEWVEGLLLNQVVADNAARPQVLGALLQMWVKLCRRLRELGIAHADIQHGNVLLVPGPRPGVFGLKLIDYDGMYLPALADRPSGEAGHPNFQHPARAAERVYSADVDRFPHLVVATALKALEAGGPELWKRYDNGDNLLFVEADFKDPAGSRVMTELWRTGTPAVRALVGRLAVACRRPIAETPWLDQLAPDGEPAPLSADEAREAAAVFESAGFVVVDSPAPGSTAPAWMSDAAVEPEADVEPEPEPEPERPRPRRRSEDDDVHAGQFPRRKPAARPRPRPRRQSATGGGATTVAIVFGVLLLIGAAVTAAVLLGRKSSDTTRSTAPDDSKTDPAPKPPDPAPPFVTPAPQPAAPAPAAPAATPNVLLHRWGHQMKDRVWIKVSGNGAHVLAYEPGRPVQVFPITGGGPRGSFTDGTPLWEFIPRPDGTVVSWAPGRPTAVVWDPGSLQAVGTLPVGNPPPLNGGEMVFDVSPDGRYVVAGYRVLGADLNPNAQGEVRVYDTQARRDVLSLRVRVPVFRFTGSSLVVGDVDKCRWFRLPDGTPESEVPVPAVPRPVVSALSPDGTQLLLGDGERTVLVVDTRTERRPSRFSSRAAIPASGFSPDGRFVAVIALPAPAAPARTYYLEVFNVQAALSVARVPISSVGQPDLTTAYFTPDGKTLAIGRQSKMIDVYDLAAAPAPSPPPAAAAPTANPSPPIVIGSRHASKVLAPAGGNTAEGTKVVTADYVAGDPGQQWRVVPAGGEWFYFEHVQTGLVMTVSGLGRFDGDEVVVARRREPAADVQLWKAVPSALQKDAAKFFTRASDKLIGIDAKLTTSGARILIWRDQEESPQWFFVIRPGS